MDQRSLLGNSDVDDVRWLCSLTESELDFFMRLKNMVNMRAKQIGHQNLAKKFDLKMLRALGCTFMEHLKGLLKDIPAASDFNSNLLMQNLSGSFSSMTIEDLFPYMSSDQKKRMADIYASLPEAEKKHSGFN